MNRSRVSMLYLAINAMSFLWIISIYSLLFSIHLIYFRLTFAAACLTLLFVYGLLKELAHHSFDRLDKLFAFSSGLTAILSVFTPFLVKSYHHVVPLPIGHLNILQSFKLSYGFLYPVIVVFIAYACVRVLILSRALFKSTYNKRPFTYSLGSLGLVFLLTFLSNFIYPMIIGSSKYSFMVVFWSLILSIGNFIAIAKYQYLNIRLVFSKSLLFLFFWGVLFSFIYGLGMYPFSIIDGTFNLTVLSCMLLFFVLIYQSTREVFLALLKTVLGDLNRNVQDMFISVSKDLLDAKTMSHVLISLKKFIDFLEGDQFVGELISGRETPVKLNDYLSESEFHACRLKVSKMSQSVAIIVEDNHVYLLLKLIQDGQYFGWFHTRLPVYKDFWIRRQFHRLNDLVALCINSLKLISSYDEINSKIKHLTNSNEFVSRLSLTSINTISTMILKQLKQTFGFDHVILPEFSHYDMQWSSSTVYVPSHIRETIMQLDISSHFSFPYDPILITLSDSGKLSPLEDVCRYYECEQCYLLPIVQDDNLIGYYIGFSKEKNHVLEFSLLSIINKQISSILYRSIISNRIATTQQFYQDIIDHLSSIIVVLNKDFDIELSNQYFQTFFNKKVHEF